MSMVVFHILHRNQVDIPFTVNISWTKLSRTENNGNLDPFNQCGRMKLLAECFGQIKVVDDKPMKFEILSAKKQQSGATLFGVFVAEQSLNSRVRAQSEGDAFSTFMEREMEIKEAVLNAFELGPVFCSKFRFTVSITRSTTISPEERMQITLDGLREFKVSKSIIAAAQEQVARALQQSATSTQTAGSNIDDEGDEFKETPGRVELQSMPQRTSKHPVVSNSTGFVE